MREDDVAALRERYSHSLEWARRFVEIGEYVLALAERFTDEMLHVLNAPRGQ